MTEIPEHIKSLMERHFLGVESLEDRAELQRWRDLNPDNEEEFVELTKIWAMAGEVLAQHAFDTARAWQSMDSRICPDQASSDYAEKTDSQEASNRKGTSLVAELPLAGRRSSLVVRMAIAAALIGIAVLIGGRVYWGAQTHGKADRTGWQMVTAADSNRKITLSDGSTVMLRKGAVLTFPGRFKDNEREVSLTGEAFFDIRQEKDRSFRVHTDRSMIEVLGTSFLVNASKETDRVVVATGKILFAENGQSGRHCILLGKQEAILSEQGFEQRAVAGANYLSWQTGDLRFDGTPLDQVAQDMSDHYGVAIRLSDILVPKAEMYKVTGDFREQPLEQPLEEIAALTGLKYRKEGDTIILYQP